MFSWFVPGSLPRTVPKSVWYLAHVEPITLLMSCCWPHTGSVFGVTCVLDGPRYGEIGQSSIMRYNAMTGSEAPNG